MRTATEPPPLKPALFHILLALAERESHGYAIMQTVREQSGGHVPLRTGSFYRHLTRLLDDGLVEAVPRPASADARRGDYYRLTPLGHRVLAQERERIAALMATIKGLPPAPRRGRA